jgi:hypothetical protein
MPRTIMASRQGRVQNAESRGRSPSGPTRPFVTDLNRANGSKDYADIGLMRERRALYEFD